MIVKEAMSKRVVTFNPEDYVSKVLKVFSKKGINGAPVMKGQKIVGVITNGDIIEKIGSKGPKIHLATSHDFLLIMAGLKSKNKADKLKKEMEMIKKLKVKHFMTKNPYIINENDDLADAADIMHKNKINRVPVINSQEKLSGILTRQDIIKAMSKF